MLVLAGPSLDRIDIRRLTIDKIDFDRCDECEKKRGQDSAERKGGAEGVLLIQLQLYGISSCTIQSTMLRTYTGEDRCDKKCTGEHESDGRRRDKDFRSMCIKMLRPQGKPPRVRGLLLVEYVECMCASTKDSKTEDDNKSCERSLRKTEGCWVDLHVDGCTIMVVQLKTSCVCVTAEAPVCRQFVV